MPVERSHVIYLYTMKSIVDVALIETTKHGFKLLNFQLFFLSFLVIHKHYTLSHEQNYPVYNIDISIHH